MLFCSLTNQLIVKSKDRIEAHMKGKRFANAKGEMKFIYLFLIFNTESGGAE